MTITRRIAYNLFAQMVILLVLAMAISLLSAVKFLPDDPLAGTITYAQASAFSHVLLHLTVITGLIGGGTYVTASERPSQALRNERLLTIAYWAWTALLIAAFFAGVLGLLEGRYLLELPPVLDAVQVAVLALFIVSIAASAAWTPPTLIWTVGLTLSTICTLIGLIPSNSYVQDRIFRVIAVDFNLNVAYVLAAVSLGFWLMTRFSNINQQWAEAGLYTVAGLLTLGGTLVSLAPLDSLGLPDWVGTLAPLFVPLAYLTFAAHSYHALSDRNPTVTLAAHWYALGVVLLLLGVGVVGAITAYPGIRQWTQGTRLTDLQTSLTTFAIIAITLGIVNQATAEMRGHNHRVTGLLPFWLVTAGLIGGAIALGAAGVVQVYLERILTIGYLDTQRLIVPLYIFWIIGLMSVALGIAIYGLGLRARRVSVRQTE